MQMSYQDFGVSSSSGGAVPAWAQRANEPLVPFFDIAGVKKAVQADLKHLSEATHKLSKLASKKNPDASVGEQLLAISSAARERARTTSRSLRSALGTVEEGSAAYRTLSALSEDFKSTLMKFQQAVEASTRLVPPAALSAGPGDAEPGMVHGGRSRGGCGSNGWDGCSSASSDRVGESNTADHGQALQLHQAAHEANETIIAEREAGIAQLGQSVQEVADIFQDLALLVNEQGTQIDNIQTNIESATAHTVKATHELVRANRSQRRARSRMCIIFLLLLLLIIILVVVLKYGLDAFS